MSLRRKLHHQLSVEAWGRPGCSPVNKVVLSLIMLNLVLQIISTEPDITAATGPWLDRADWAFTAVFVVEYLARLWVAPEGPRYRGPLGRLRYLVSPFALIDLLAIVPAFLSAGTLNASGLRALRLLRVLRFARFGALSLALTTITEVFASRMYELAVSLGMVLTMLLVSATAMYFAEGHIQPDQFGSIPRAMWWAVVTMTTVGYGDVFPVSPTGKVIAAVVQLTAIAMVAIPTGILAASFVEAVDKRKRERLQVLDDVRAAQPKRESDDPADAP